MSDKPITYLVKDDTTGAYYECDEKHGFPVYSRSVNEQKLLAELKTENEKQAKEIENLHNWIQTLVEIPFFDGMAFYRGVPVEMIREIPKEKEETK